LNQRPWNAWTLDEPLPHFLVNVPRSAFNPGDMQKQFEEGTLATAVGKMSGIVVSDSGHHLIFRTA
jgi:hypothetical protein